ncbi:hypothetical protein BDZ85DRAFT_84744 [Elsinoe ampelina]|uniref:Uncharacterized protein n=1 Tax=Elsinoe ampelina TaxID=302913 RepID=A0A6A6GGG8_9PEZI|nr:hypothetical protein BDZ85DRAFT_84744 [Elsinoe ampelina]
MSSPATTAGGRPVEMGAQDCVKELLGTSLQLHLNNATGDPIVKAQSEAKAAAAFNLWQVMVSRSCSPSLLYWPVQVDGETLIVHPERAAALKQLMEMMSTEASRLGFSIALAYFDKEDRSLSSSGNDPLCGKQTPPEKVTFARLVDITGKLMNEHSITADFEEMVLFCHLADRKGKASVTLETFNVRAKTGQAQKMALVFLTAKSLQCVNLQPALSNSGRCKLEGLLQDRGLLQGTA